MPSLNIAHPLVLRMLCVLMLRFSISPASLNALLTDIRLIALSFARFECTWNNHTSLGCSLLRLTMISMTFLFSRISLALPVLDSFSFKGSPAPINLVVPPHKYLTENTLLIGVDTEEKA